MNKDKKIKLLAPSGNYEAMLSAVKAGADAIYMGGSMFSARAYAANFDDDQLRKTVDYCHNHNVEVYLTVNTLIKDMEMRDCLEFVSYLNQVGVDAIIIQDIGLISLIRKCTDTLPLHISTQGAISSYKDIKSLEKLNVQRIVLPRELTVQEIKQIHSQTDIELEAFIHGALCVSYSGRCLFSALNGGRSGNRGSCAQVCRKDYKLYQDNKLINDEKSAYVMSPKDLKTIDNIDKILDAGVTSLKIEGRMKSKEYVYTVTRCYREIIDYYMKNGFIDKELLKEANDTLVKVFNRSFTKGYILGSQGKNIINSAVQKPLGQVLGTILSYDNRKKRLKISLKDSLCKGDGISLGQNVGRIISNDGKIIDKASKGQIIYLDWMKDEKKGSTIYKTFDSEFEEKVKRQLEIEKKIEVEGFVKAKKGEKLSLTLISGDVSINCISEQEVSKAEKRPVTKEDIYKQISKTGDTIFELSALNYDVQDDIFIPVKQLNELRRQAFDQLYDKIARQYKREYIDFTKYFDEEIKEDNIKTEKENKFVIYFKTKEQLYALEEYKEHIKYAATSNTAIIQEAKNILKDKLLYKLPSQISQSEVEDMDKKIESYGLQTVFSNSGYEENGKIANYHLNLYNSFSHKYYNEKGIYTVASLENIFSNQDDYIYMKDKTKVIIPIYMYPELMITLFCPYKKEDGKCSYDYKCHLPKTNLENKEKDVFSMEKMSNNNGNCKNIIYDPNPYKIDKNYLKDLNSEGFSLFLIEFKEEDDAKVKETLKNYISQLIK